MLTPTDRIHESEWIVIPNAFIRAFCHLLLPLIRIMLKQTSFHLLLRYLNLNYTKIVC